MAISTVSIHVFGDVPSSPLVGVLQVKLRFRDAIAVFWFARVVGYLINFIR